FCLRILIQVLHVRVRRRRIYIEVILLDVLTVVSLTTGQAKQTFFQDRIVTVPQREGETDLLMSIRDSCDSIFVPAVSARPSVIVWKVVPGGAVRTVIFTNRAPGTFAEIR